eukprot:6604077-Prymnesium_polylepis.2
MKATPALAPDGFETHCERVSRYCRDRGRVARPERAATAQRRRGRARSHRRGQRSLAYGVR